MTKTTKPQAIRTDSKPAKDKLNKHFRLIDRTYENNKNSDYTEKIETLGKEFDYSQNRDYYWGNPELSTLYGTPLYEVASESQKLALNHLYWIGQYQHTAGSEANTMLYNLITSGVFANIEGYETLCQELDFETFQERFHINTFQRIGYKTKVALLGKESLGNPLHSKLNMSASSQSLLDKITKLRRKKKVFRSSSASNDLFLDSALRSITKLIFRGKSQYYSRYLQEKASSPIPTTSGGLAGLTASPSIFKFLSLNWGSSPFLAAQYYSTRMIANMSLKTYEHPYFKHFKNLSKTGEFIPAPTAVSHYHLLDEAFHTTMSQVIAQDVYKDFAKPTVYEKLLANRIINLLQRNLLSGLSGALPAVFRDDACFMSSYYRLLTSRLFEMSSEEALDWMKKCLCQEHDGFHVNLKYHSTLLSDLSKFFGRLDYLSPVNREMRLMANGASIDRAIKRNTDAFQKFANSITQN